MPSDTTCLLLAQSVPLHFYLTTVPDSQTRKQQADSSCSYQIGHPTRRRTEVCGCFPRAGGQAEAPSLLHVSGWCGRTWATIPASLSTAFSNLFR